MKVQHFATALAAALLVVSGSSWMFSAEAAPGSALQRVRTNSRIRQGMGEDIVLNSSAPTSTVVASIASDTVVTDDSYAGQALREVRTRSRIRRGVGEDIL